MKTIFAVLLGVQLLWGVPCLGEDEPESCRILQMIGAKEVSDTVVIDYQLDAYSSVSRPPRDEIAMRANEIRNGFPQSVEGKADDPKMESAFEQLAEDYTTGREHGADRVTSWGTLYISQDFVALSTVQSTNDQCERWEVRKGNAYYQYVVSNNAGYIQDKSNGQCEDELEEALCTVGLLGAPPKERAGMHIVPIRAWDKEMAAMTNESVSRWREGADIHMAKGAREITVEDLGNGQYRLRSFELNFPDVPQFLKTSFEEYGKFGNEVLPSKVRSVFCSRDADETWIYTVKEVRHCTEVPLVPFVNAVLPAAEMVDTRYSPHINYRVSSTLPDAKQIAEWARDPAALKKYNAMIKSGAVN